MPVFWRNILPPYSVSKRILVIIGAPGPSLGNAVETEVLVVVMNLL
jgi:hypothetical protein